MFHILKLTWMGAEHCFCKTPNFLSLYIVAISQSRGEGSQLVYRFLFFSLVEGEIDLVERGSSEWCCSVCTLPWLEGILNCKEARSR